jgi:hypothetical protein
MTHAVTCFSQSLSDQFMSPWSSVVSAWSKPKPKPDSKLTLVQDSRGFGSETEHRKGWQRPVQTRKCVGNDAFSYGDFHGSNNWNLSRSIHIRFWKWPIKLPNKLNTILTAYIIQHGIIRCEDIYVLLAGKGRRRTGHDLLQSAILYSDHRNLE